MSKPLIKMEIESRQWQRLMLWTAIAIFVSMLMCAFVAEHALVKLAGIWLILFCLEFGIWIGLRLSINIYEKYRE